MKLLKQIATLLLAVVMLAGVMPAAYAVEDNAETTVVENEVLVESLVLNAHKITWPEGKAGYFKPTVLPENATNKTLKWSSSDPSVATISEAGKLTAVSVGTAKIYCETTDGSELLEVCDVTVTSNNVKATSLKLNCKTINWPVGKSASFKATVLPENATNKTLKWSSSDPSVATVSQEGKLTAVSVGTTKIFCETTDGSDLMAICDVTVKSNVVKATSLKLNCKTINWPVGKSASFKATVLPTDTTNQKLSWTSSVKRVASVDANGKLTALSPGTTTITCKTTDGSNLKATCVVTVTNGIKVKTLKLNCKTINWEVGKSASFKATVTPSNATNQTLKWTSSNTKVATVSQTGLLTAVGEGKATITCATTDGSNLKATCAVTVRFIKATGLKLNCKTINWLVGKSASFKATITPSNATVKQLEWHSSNIKVATVSQEGLLTAVFPGTTTITCKTTDGTNLKATCKVTVYDPNNVPVTSLNFAEDALSWPIGKTDYVTPEIAPEDATNKTLKWHSSDNAIVRVDADGKITALSEGIAIVNCKTTDGSDLIKSFKVFVYNPLGIKATDLELNAQTLNWKVGKTGTFKATVSPSLATNKTLDWSSSNTDVVIINDNGFIKAIGEGVSVVTVRTVDGSNLKATCKVVVGPADITAEDYDGSGLLGFAWDPAQKCFFSAKNSWQRNFGFCDVYDVAAPFTVMYYDTVRVKFRYDDRDWMVQMWKGQYGIFLGCEIGVYYKDIDSKIEFYECVADEDLLYMDSTLYREGEKLFSRKYDKYWWITGFKTGALKNIADRSELSMDSTITFHTKEMMDAFLVAFENKGFYEGEHYWVSGKSVTFTWHLQKDPRNEK